MALCVPSLSVSVCVRARVKQPPPLGLSSFTLRVQQRGCAVASRLSRALDRQALIAPLCDRDVGKTDGTRSEPLPARGDENVFGSKAEGGVVVDGAAAGAESERVAEMTGDGKAKAGGEGGGSATRAGGGDENVSADVEDEEECEDDSLAEHYDPAMSVHDTVRVIGWYTPDMAVVFWRVWLP